MKYFQAPVSNDHFPIPFVGAIGGMTGTLVQMASSLYNSVGISSMKGEYAYFLVQCAPGTRSPPKTKKTQRGRQPLSLSIGN